MRLENQAEFPENGAERLATGPNVAQIVFQIRIIFS